MVRLLCNIANISYSKLFKAVVQQSSTKSKFPLAVKYTCAYGQSIQGYQEDITTHVKTILVYMRLQTIITQYITQLSNSK